MQCYILEDPVREHWKDGEWVWKPEYKIAGKTAIPSGTYPIDITYSNRFRKELLLLRDVPDFKGVRIHKGNWPENTEGCLLPGRIPGTDVVLESAKAFDPLFELIRLELSRGGGVEIEIENSNKLLDA